MEKIGIFGLWHLGTVLSAAWSSLGNIVIGFDYNKEKIVKLQQGLPPIFEPNLDETLKENLSRKLITFTADISDLSECDFVFIAYDTPVLDDDSSDTSILTQSISDLRNILKDKGIVIISSQTPVGFCSELRLLLKEKNPTFELVYSPENLRLGEAIQCYLDPGRIILGTADKMTEVRCLKLFGQIRAEVHTMNHESAEMVKHGINSFLATSIVFANHLADICEEKKAVMSDVIRGMKSDPRIGTKAYLSPGIGFSGGTLGRDLKVLEKINDATNGFAKIFGAVHKHNNERKYAIITKIEKYFGKINNSVIGVCGLTYKPGTSTLRRSLPLEIVDLIISNGGKVQVYDPRADYSELHGTVSFQIMKTLPEVAVKADCILILTEWPEFKLFDWGSIKHLMKEPIIFDTKNILDQNAIIKSGFKYHSIGR